MHPMWWPPIAIVTLVFVVALLNVLEEHLREQRATRHRAMRRRLGKFEAQQRVRQQAAVMQRTREINAMAHETCHAMLRAALEAQRKELDSYIE